MGPDDRDPSFRFLKAYYLIGQALTARATARLEQTHGLEVRDLIALSYIVWGGVNTPTALAYELQLPRYVVSRTLEKLVRTGVLERRFDPEDARRTRLGLTEEGLALHQAAILEIQSTVQPLLDAFDGAPAFLEALERLASHLADTPEER